MYISRTFFEEYEEDIAPIFKRVDVLLRSGDEFTPAETARALDISPDEVFAALSSGGGTTIDKRRFLTVMRNGSSKACELLRREVECGCPAIYLPRQIAYIYGLDENDVERACDELSFREVSAECLPLIFERIPVAC